MTTSYGAEGSASTRAKSDAEPTHTMTSAALDDGTELAGVLVEGDLL